ncbi:hypothetical protein BH10BAC2_BH10BAC2_39850 [soil metagenome]
MTEKELDESRKLIATFFKQRREELNMTQEELAEKTGVGLSTIKRFESAKFWPVLKHFLIFCEALNLSPAAIPFDISTNFIKEMRDYWIKDQKKK